MRIGLIAMSGIRVRDEELVRVGLTLPGFVERSLTIASLPSLGLLTLAALTPAEHQVEYIEMPDIALFDELPDGFDLAAISSYSAQIDEAYELAQRYRERGTKVVIGGPHVTVVPEEALQFCDSVVVGEGEPCWPEVIEDAKAGRLKTVYDARKREYDLTAAPMPAYDLLDIENYNRLTVQTSRGCPHRCEFCAGSILLADHYKQKPIAKVLAEIDKIREIWPHPFIEFADDNSLVNRSYWKELLTEMIPRHLRWFTETDISVAEDEELLTLMRRAGCAQVLIGFESPVVDGLAGLELNNDWKYRRFAGYREAIRKIQAHGVTVNGCFVLGLDGHTTAIFDEVYEFVRASELYEVQATVLTPFPGTPLYERLKRDGRLLEPTNWKKCTLFDVNFVPAKMAPEELTRGFRKLIARLYSDEFTAQRREVFKKNLRQFHGEKGGGV